MIQRTVDLASHLNQIVQRGHPADFPVTLRPVFYRSGEVFEPVGNRLAVVREDTGQALAVVSDRYRLVPHQRILDVMEDATARLDVGPVPRGIYVDHQGSRLRAIFKFPALARPVLRGDDICPCLKVLNTYDGTSRIAVHIGAFRFVCTNLAVGGGGVFAGGFMSVHAGEIPIEQVAEQLTAYLTGFEGIVKLYQRWTEEALTLDVFTEILGGFPKRAAEAIRARTQEDGAQTVYEAYNVATRYATHETRSYRAAFELLEKINRGFQQHFAPSPS